MSIFRSYVNKNNTLISTNDSNVSRNPVTELCYGGIVNTISRHIFSIDVDDLCDSIRNGRFDINENTKHVLRMYNTISNRSDLIGCNYPIHSNSVRTSGFKLQLYNITEDWNQGNGYFFTYDYSPSINTIPSNWKKSTPLKDWNNIGCYDPAAKFIGEQFFDVGNENLEIDITDYVNKLINDKIGSSYPTNFTDTTYGIILKYSDELENLTTDTRNIVAFHTKFTNTTFDPHVETTTYDTISDDRDDFYIGEDCNLYYYPIVNSAPTSVDIYDYNGKLVENITDIKKVKGNYSITLNVDDVDSVIYTDVWNLSNGKKISNTFYLKNRYENYTDLDSSMPENFHISLRGIASKERMRSGDVKKASLNIRQFNSMDVDYSFKYRVYMKNGGEYQYDIIPSTPLDKGRGTYYFILDTTWMKPQDYYIDVYMNIEGIDYLKVKSHNFRIINNFV